MQQYEDMHDGRRSWPGGKTPRKHNRREWMLNADEEYQQEVTAMNEKAKQFADQQADRNHWPRTDAKTAYWEAAKSSRLIRVMRQRAQREAS